MLVHSSIAEGTIGLGCTASKGGMDPLYAKFRTLTEDYLKRWNLYRSERAAVLHTYACATSVKQACQLKLSRCCSSHIESVKRNGDRRLGSQKADIRVREASSVP
jgi:hypothetical protein